MEERMIKIPCLKQKYALLGMNEWKNIYFQLRSSLLYVFGKSEEGKKVCNNISNLYSSES